MVGYPANVANERLEEHLKVEPNRHTRPVHAVWYFTYDSSAKSTRLIVHSNPPSEVPELSKNLSDPMLTREPLTGLDSSLIHIVPAWKSPTVMKLSSCTTVASWLQRMSEALIPRDSAISGLRASD